MDINDDDSNEEFKTEDELSVVNEEQEELDIVDKESEINEAGSIMFEEAYDKSSEVIEEAPNVSKRPRREGAGQGIKRLKASFDGKTYNSGNYNSQNSFQFTMKAMDTKDDKDIKFLEVNSFLRIAVNETFAQFSEHAQMLANKGIQKFGERSITSIFKEYKQLNDGVI